MDRPRLRHDLPEVRPFACGLNKDLKAVTTGCATACYNGCTEGAEVTRRCLREKYAVGQNSPFHSTRHSNLGQLAARTDNEPTLWRHVLLNHD